MDTKWIPILPERLRDNGRELARCSLTREPWFIYSSWLREKYENTLRLIRRGNRSGTLYCVDTLTGKRTSLQTFDEDEAQQIVQAKNQAERQKVLNLQIAKAYLAGSDSGISERTWQQALDATTERKRGANQERWQRAGKDKAFDLIRESVIIETKADTFSRRIFSQRVSVKNSRANISSVCFYALVRP